MRRWEGIADDWRDWASFLVCGVDQTNQINQTDQMNQINKTNQFEHPAGSLSCCAVLVRRKEYRFPPEKSSCPSGDVKREDNVV